MAVQRFGAGVLLLFAVGVLGVGRNLPPRAELMVVQATSGTPTSFTLRASDPDGDPLSFVVLGGPLYGQLGGQAPHLTYTADRGFVGVDEMRFAVIDPCGAFDLGSVRLEVRPEIIIHRVGQVDPLLEPGLASLAADLAQRGVEAWFIFTQRHACLIGQPIPVLLPPGGELRWVSMYHINRGETRFVPVDTDWDPRGWLRVLTDACLPGIYVLTAITNHQAFSFLVSLETSPTPSIHLTARQPE